MRARPKEIEVILKAGHSLANVGVNNWALTRNQALNALDQLMSLEVPILGGDVYEGKNGLIQSNYENWYCDSLQGESRSDFAKRSIREARKYIESYKSKDPENIFFVLVLKY